MNNSNIGHCLEGTLDKLTVIHFEEIYRKCEHYLLSRISSLANLELVEEPKGPFIDAEELTLDNELHNI